MSFTISRELVKRDFYPALGVEMPDEKVTKEVTYSAISASVDSENSAVAQFKVAIDGCFITGYKEYSFTRTGTGDLLEEAEASLKSSLE
ncbi:hypothetical protein ACNF2L_16390 [Klebsiella pneumoniae]|uniref:hypothetical protein n=1 Tax=Klebsiella pneumoniae TaxID=573 RepID=UPI002A92EAE5|nr:hypothetical protein [Klebsiella pneumoniae]HEL6236786.1 hypothetical protein [Klebsiella pneumoniae]